jgi:nucleoid DNA-binding protein
MTKAELIAVMAEGAAVTKAAAAKALETGGFRHLFRREEEGP